MNTVISQAMATGLPVITTAHSGLPEQVIDGKNGAVVPEGDFEALADKLVFLIEHPELWPEYGRFARERAGENYDSKKLIEFQIEQYLRLLPER
jgi:colanic acid/amylovoran biosynthesis glycosyltransferase